MSDVPAWISERVALCRDVLGCHTIHIGLSMSDAPGGNAEYGAITERFYDYLSARLIFRCDLEDNEQGRITVAHEMLHVALMHLVDHVELIICMLPSDRRSEAYQILRSGLEPNIEHMARALSPFLDQWKSAETTGE